MSGYRQHVYQKVGRYHSLGNLTSETFITMNFVVKVFFISGEFKEV